MVVIVHVDDVFLVGGGSKPLPSLSLSPSLSWPSFFLFLSCFHTLHPPSHVTHLVLSCQAETFRDVRPKQHGEKRRRGTWFAGEWLDEIVPSNQLARSSFQLFASCELFECKLRSTGTKYGFVQHRHTRTDTSITSWQKSGLYVSCHTSQTKC